MSDTGLPTALARELGSISAKLDNLHAGQQAHSAKLDSMDDRLRAVERKSALNGGVAGGVVAVTIGLIKSQFSGGS
ncbi:hypothetical protein RA27_20480 [Ruegeria sp. ANG-R]|uniref:hypothetical protein n=1 Tax=Ruegeria sp. ANG-R TaxID=1577903 RepID=UPI00057CB495|nr:hypothetical protein [Ruegeria sp. ANG-R]KIC38148.1 hypothetical protein RA27_20480 [Ruegeria sp. ANG-R]